MSSGRSSFIRRMLIKCFPFAFSKCPSGNLHPITDQFCICGDGSYPVMPIYRKIQKRWRKIGNLDMKTREDLNA